MARQVLVNTDQTTLPDGGTYNTGDVVTLTDQQFQQIAATALGDEVTDQGRVADPGDAVVNQAAAVAAPPALTATAAAGANPTKAEFDALLADVTALRTTVANTLAALKVEGGPMASA